MKLKALLLQKECIQLTVSIGLKAPESWSVLVESQPGLWTLREQLPWMHETVSTTQDVKSRLCQAMASVRHLVCQALVGPGSASP